jgi:hypothetical protein
VIQVLLVAVVVKRDDGAFLRDPFHEGRVAAAEILPLQQFRDLFHRLGVELVELRRGRSVSADVGQDTASGRVADLRRREQHRRDVGG